MPDVRSDIHVSSTVEDLVGQVSAKVHSLHGCGSVPYCSRKYTKYIVERG